MKTYISRTLSALLVFGFLFSFSLVSAQSATIENPLGYQDFEGLVNAIINFLIKVATPLAAIMFVVSGVLFVTSTGDPGRVSTARKVALYTAIGYGVILMSSGLIKVLQSLLKGS